MRSLPDDLRPSSPEAFDGVSRMLLIAFVVINLAFWALVVSALR